MKKFFYTLRSVLRFKGNTVIKLISLTLGLVVGLLLFAFNAFELSYDDFHPDGDRMYRIGIRWSSNEQSQEVGMSYEPVAPAMGVEIPEVEAATRILDVGSQGYRLGENDFKERTIYADSAFFKVFAYRMLSGVPQEELTVPWRIFLSEKFAAKLFGTDNPVGKTMMIVGILALIITILGLIGFTGDEIARRTKEIALRKVNGATIRNVIVLLWQEAGWMSLVAIPVGLLLAYYAGQIWLEQFAYQASLNWWIFAVGAFVTVSFVLITVTLRSYRAATMNPVKALKSE